MKRSLNIILCGTLTLWLALPTVVISATKAKQRTIVKVEPIRVETPVGTVPRLPWQVWVTYSDGTHEWRQTKWSNYLPATEQRPTPSMASSSATTQRKMDIPSPLKCLLAPRIGVFPIPNLLHSHFH